MKEHPYKQAPAHSFWRRSLADIEPSQVDPVVNFPIRIDPNTRVATAGSCFAQHIARYLRNSGFNYYVTEPGHPILPELVRTKNNYGLFSARYGNIYTARQLIQLVERAYGRFVPVESVWQEADDVFLDPFRPSAQPGGFISQLELELDRTQHLAAVREMLETLDVFVFTLGLTECWMSRQDGAVFPICPGVEGGVFDPDRHVFYNQTLDDVIADMTSFLMMLARINPRAQVILTVSPVPLAATARHDQHVLAATTYSKSVLRVAAETLATRFAHVAYFPSYEIITGAFNRGGYFAPDLRNVVESGVSHVMGLFMKHATGPRMEAGTKNENPSDSSFPAGQGDAYLDLARHVVEVECDEAALDRP
ncbi:GSCFA domain-containing protein [Novosphingobium ginsenosidimutans]|uniref:GSCFA domain-containing protein n=1 Tax=Novosphingobium ginsenosidimutans TaxID=1176536 RepID=A0A5B8S3C8_9SPHN|nr:GSCFA domain-containing protein [Novosphingobium ginsenosidimutans]QEA15813.1 GSCFA domain-containing protein [Novosphingobium ginsenosidimutans]